MQFNSSIVIHHYDVKFEVCFIRHMYTLYSGAENTLKVGVYFDIFPIFCQFQKVGGVTKSRPIDLFFDVVYLFLNVRFGQKVFKFTVFGCIMHVSFDTFCRRLNFFYSIAVNFFDDLFFAHPPFFLHLVP